MLKIVKDSAVKARTQAINQIKALIVTAPSELRHELVSLDVSRLVARCARFRPGHLATPPGQQSTPFGSWPVVMANSPLRLKV